jgi:nitrogen regulatory protein P-II 1
MNFKIIMAMVKPELTEKVVDAAKSAGATGDVIIPARGSGVHQTTSFFGLYIEDKTEIIMFLVGDCVAEKICKTIQEVAEFHKPGRGIAVVLNVDSVIGLESQIDKYKEFE